MVVIFAITDNEFGYVAWIVGHGATSSPKVRLSPKSHPSSSSLCRSAANEGDATQGGMIDTTGAIRTELENPPIRLDVGFGLDPPELATASSNFAHSSVVLTSEKSLQHHYLQVSVALKQVQQEPCKTASPYVLNRRHQSSAESCFAA
ncbi:hypothetical protein PIB30_093031 [Stylosanthes scabra]|uniref:Uncharacterized protein n=1 Tax=Stylosanthes scabra TaxID=79078 RepID=A0ABU6WTC7_9FABA|nr:hypothetical protein [Stylosanthes scabra]